MSLFHTKEWWTHKPEFPSECSPASMLLSNIDSDPSNSEKLITASFSGHLRIFSPSHPPRVEDLLLESSMDEPILQLEAGRFLSGSSRTALAVLFPKKLSVYVVNSIKPTASSSPSAPSYLELSLSYTHRFHHHAHCMTCGPFGSSTSSSLPHSSSAPRDSIAVLTLDGQLLFYSQDTFAFSRYLPGFLLPGAFLYVRSIDAFVLSTACNEIECYRYSVLGESSQGERKAGGSQGAEEEEEESKESKEQMLADFKQAVSSSKRLHTEWTVNIGEHILDIQTGRVCRDAGGSSGSAASASSPSAGTELVVLSKHSLWVLKESGGIRQTKRLDYCPLSLRVFPTQTGCDHVLVGSEEQSVFIYSDMRLLWAARSTVSPCTALVSTSLSLSTPGLLCLHSDTNECLVAYLGTDPPLQTVSTAQSRELDYDGMDTEHRKLLKVVRQAAGDRMQEPKEKLILKVLVAAGLREEEAADAPELSGRELQRDDRGRPLCADVRIVLSHTAVLPMNRVQVSLLLPAAFVTPEPAVFIASLVAASSSSASTPFILTFPVYLLSRHHVHSLSFDVVASYLTPDNLTRCCKAEGRLPLSLYARVRPAVKNTAFFFTLDCNRQPPPLPALFPDLFESLERDGQGGGVTADGSANVFSLFTWGWNEDVTLLVSKKTGRYRLQSSAYTAFAPLMLELVLRLQAHYADSKPQQQQQQEEDGELLLRFEEELPFGEYFPLVEQHHAQRLALSSLYARLSRLSLQFRAIQKRLLVRYRDKNPQPMLAFDRLMEETQARIQQLTEQQLQDEQQAAETAERLSSATAHLALLMTLKHGLDRKNADYLRQLLHVQGGEERGPGSGLLLDSQGGSGWHERLDVALIHALKFVLTKTAKPAAAAGGAAGAAAAAGGGEAEGNSAATQHTEVMKDIGRIKKHLVMLNERLSRGLRFVPHVKEPQPAKAHTSPGTPPAGAGAGRRRDESRRQNSVDLREASQTLVEVEEEEG